MLRRARPEDRGGQDVEGLTQLLKPLSRYLNDNELFYVFTGDLALRLLGCADGVRAVELVLNLTPEQRARTLNFLSQEDFVVESEGRGLLELRHRPTGTPVRMRMAGGGREAATLARRVPITVGYLSIFIPSTEDLVLDLLERGGGDEESAAALYLKWRNFLDMEHLLASARSRGLQERLLKVKKMVDM
ncbi:MAG: hypothetical protein ACUVV6_00585 [Thermoplasmatota archaeon]